jgi:hypothetical protein
MRAFLWLIVPLLLLNACSEVVLGDRIGQQKIAQIEIRNPGIVSYDIWLVIRSERLALESEYLLLTGLEQREDALTFVEHVGLENNRVVVRITANDKLSDHETVMTDGTRVKIVTAK